MKKRLLILGAVSVVLVAFGFTTSTKMNNTDKVNDNITICHYPPGNPANVQVITISESAWAAHDAHGDVVKPHCGPCPCYGEQE